MRENPAAYEAFMKPRLDEDGMPLEPLEVVRFRLGLIFDRDTARKKLRNGLTILARADEFGLPEDTCKRIAENVRLMDLIVNGGAQAAQSERKCA